MSVHLSCLISTPHTSSEDRDLGMTEEKGAEYE